jgi:hypothetical protein
MNTTNRNDPCICGSGKKYKKCCYQKDQERRQAKRSSGGLFGGSFFSNPQTSKTALKMLKNVKVVNATQQKSDSKGVSHLFSKSQPEVIEEKK